MEEAKKEANVEGGESSAPKKPSGPIKATNKTTDENPFGSDDSDEEKSKPKDAQPKKTAPASKRSRIQAESDGEEEEDAPRKKQVKPTAAAIKGGRAPPRVAVGKQKMELSDDSD